MKAIIPALVTPIVLTASNVPEDEYAAWSSAIVYPKGSRVISDHRIYESAVNTNVAQTPGASTAWLDAGPTNRWAMFDQAAGPKTTAAGDMAITLTLVTPVQAIGFYEVDAASVRVQVKSGSTTLYDKRQSTTVDGRRVPTVSFFDLPAAAGQTIVVSVTGTGGSTALGKLIIGSVLDVGATEDEPTISLLDYSRRETDDYGVTSIVERDWTTRLELRTKIPSTTVDLVERTLAAIRAQAVLWIGEAGFESLTCYGFFKDFSIALPLPDLSFCTLTIESLPTPGVASLATINPAPGETDRQLRVIDPVTIAEANLVSSNVAESDYAEWTNAGIYAAGNRVISLATHRIYESIADGNQGHDPIGNPDRWLDIGSTNRWAMFDQALGSATINISQIVVTLAPGTAINALAIIDTNALSVRVQAPGYNKTKTLTAANGLDLGSVIFLDLATAPTDQITITITAIAEGQRVSAGSLVTGQLVNLGLLEAQPTLSIRDFSKKDADDFGNVVPIQRAWAKRMVVRTLISAASVYSVLRKAAGVRAKAAVWVGQEGIESLTVFGFFRDLSIKLGENACICSLTVEGLSTATALAPLSQPIGWSDVIDDNGKKPADNATVGAPAGTMVGDKPAAAVAAAIDQLGNIQDQVDAIIAGGAGSGGADAAALAAAAARDAAQLARDNAQTYATNASGSAGAAAGSASTATTKAGEAASAASAAQGFATSAQNYSTTASTKADTATTQASVATEAAAAAAASVTVSARVGAAALNANPLFLAYTTSGHPDFWGLWTGADGTRVSGINGNPYAYQAAVAAGADNGIAQEISAVGAGWYVVEGLVTLVSGDTRGAGVYLVGISGSNVGVASQMALLSQQLSGADTVTVIGNGTPGKTYSISALVQIANPAVVALRLYAMTGYTASGESVTAKTLNWHKCLVRPALASEIAAVRADINATQALATASSEASTRASQDAALAQRAATLEAQLAGTTPSGLKASISDVATVAANAQGAAASALQTVSAAGNSNPNLQANGGFELETPYTFGAPAGVADDTGSGRRVLHWENPGTTVALMRPMNLAPGYTYTVSWDQWVAPLPAGSGGVRIDPCFFTGPNATGSGLYDTQASPSVQSYDWRTGRRSHTFTVPGGYASTQLRLISDAIQPGAISIWFARVKVEIGSAPTPYNGDATVVTSAGAAATALGRLSAYWQVQAIAGGDVARVAVFADNGAGGVRSGILLDASNVFVSGNLIVAGSVNTPALAQNTVTRGWASNGGYLNGNGNWQQACYVGINLPYDSFVTVQGCGLSVADNTVLAQFAFSIDSGIDAATSSFILGNTLYSSFAMSSGYYLSAGFHTIEILFNGPTPGGGGGAVINRSGLVVTAFQR